MSHGGAALQVQHTTAVLDFDTGYVSPYEDFLEMQKDKYSVDLNGEICVVDQRDGEEVEDPMAGEGSPDDTKV